MKLKFFKFYHFKMVGINSDVLVKIVYDINFGFLQQSSKVKKLIILITKKGNYRSKKQV